MDLFEKYPIELADDESHPAPCRYVTFAGHYAEEILDDLAKLGSSLVVHDAHAVIGQVAEPASACRTSPSVPRTTRIGSGSTR